MDPPVQGLTSGGVPVSSASELWNSRWSGIRVSLPDVEIESEPFNLSGHFGDVFRGRHPMYGVLALKRLRTGLEEDTSSLVRRFSREAETWKTLVHPHVLPFLGTGQRGNHIYLISPFAVHGTVIDYLRRNPHSERSKLLREIGSALSFLHSRSIIHGDLKGRNVLVCPNLSAQVCDFGLARYADCGTSTNMKGTGTLRWSSPEILNGDSKTYASDVYAFGMTIVEILSGAPPFSEYQNDVAVIKAVVYENERPSRTPLKSADGVSYDKEWEVAELCWAKDPGARPSIDQVLLKLGDSLQQTVPVQSVNTTIDDLRGPDLIMGGGLTPPFVHGSVHDSETGASRSTVDTTIAISYAAQESASPMPPRAPTSEHRLQENELPQILAMTLMPYQSKPRLPSPFVSKEIVSPNSTISTLQATPLSTAPSLTVNGELPLSADLSQQSELSTSVSIASSLSALTRTPRAPKARRLSLPSADEAPLPSGVSTLLTDCYSPTCTRDAPCYSNACPRRLEQQARLNMKPQPGLRRSLSNESLGDTPIRETGALWIHSVPPEIAASVSDQEKKRQEAINEVIYTERDFVRDMEYLRDCWVKPLRTSNIIPEHRRIQFIQQVFWNLDEIIAVNTRLRDALNKRQKSYAIVDMIGDIYLDVVEDFESFVRYGSHQLYGKFEFEKEKSSNAAFAQFVEETERLPESRKLELNGYLTKPTTRLARYPLYLEIVLNYTSDDDADKAQLVEVVKIIRGFLRRVNEERWKTENRFNLLHLDQQLVFRDGEQVDLRLRDENRELLYKGTLKRRGGQGDNGDLQVFLFDHALLMVKAKTKHEQFRVYRRPIPLDLLVVAAQEEPSSNRSANKGPRQTTIKRNSISNVRERDRENGLLPFPLKSDSKNGYPIAFMHLGRKGYVLTLWASTVVGRKKWLEEISKQQEVMRERSMTFDTPSLSEGFFFGENKVNCAAPFDHGSQIAYGTDNGVYFSDLRDRSREPVHVLALPDVMQVDVLEEYELLVVLSERSVMTIPLDALDVNDPTAGLKRAKKVSSHTSFFKAGTGLGRTLVCVVKASALSTTIKTLEPIDQATRGKKLTFKKLFQGENDTLRMFKEIYLPCESSSIHFLKTKLCVGCTKGFEIVDLETLDTQGLLDPADPSLDFVQKRENTRPIAIYRIENDFLLCYDEFAFYLNKNGWRARPNWIVHWEGFPTLFALHYPFVLAFEPTFIEIRNIDTGQLVQIIPGNNLRCLFADTPPTLPSAANYAHMNPHVRGNPYIYPQPPDRAQSLPPPGAWPQQQYGGYPGAAYGMPPPFHRNQPYTRDEIIIVSDDKVMAVRLAPPPALRQQLATSMAASENTIGNGSVVSDTSSLAGSWTFVA